MLVQDCPTPEWLHSMWGPPYSALQHTMPYHADVALFHGSSRHLKAAGSLGPVDCAALSDPQGWEQEAEAGRVRGKPIDASGSISSWSCAGGSTYAGTCGPQISFSSCGP